MEQLSHTYDSSSGSDTDELNKSLALINPAPGVSSIQEQKQYVAHDALSMTRNLPAYATLTPLMGPENPYTKSSLQITGAGKRLGSGVVESANVEDFCFETQYHTYNQFGYARDVSGRVIGTSAKENVDETIYTKKKRKSKKKDETSVDVKEDIGENDTDGIWAPCQEEEESFVKFSDYEMGTMTEDQEKIRQEREAKRAKKADFDEDVDFDRMIEKKRAHLLPARLKPGQEVAPSSSKFHGEAEFDYQGRPWCAPPKSIKPDDGDHPCYIPKRCVHTWMGHTKGVQAIEFSPKYGHLLLSGSMDHSLKIWDVAGDRECKRTYNGHTAAVRGINFNNDGSRFLSCSFDRYIRLWDTETGKCIHTFTNRRVPYCVKFYPEDNNLFVIGDSNNMVVQFDCTSGEIVQEYNHHLQAVNSVTFVDDNRKFVSTSDDKKILIWEWNIPVPIKYISEPSMHSMPAVTLHPTGAFFAGQSLNNQIDVYSAKDKFKLSRNKVFRGHVNAGYACQIGFSPNGQFLMSGDGEGRCYFWDWKTTKMYKKFKAHEKGPCIGAIWHPIESSKVATCGWDGLIKYWD